MDTSNKHILACITDSTDQDWETKFIPGYDLLLQHLSEDEIAVIACAIWKTFNPENPHIQNKWNLSARISALRDS